MCVCVCVFVCVCVRVRVCVQMSSLKPAKFNVKPPWDRGRKFIQMSQVICCSSILSTSGDRGLLAGILLHFFPAVQGVKQGFKN